MYHDADGISSLLINQDEGQNVALLSLVSSCVSPNSYSPHGDFSGSTVPFWFASLIAAVQC